MGYSFPKNAKHGDEILLDNGALYRFSSNKRGWMIVDSVDPRELWLHFPHMYQMAAYFDPQEYRPLDSPLQPQFASYGANDKPDENSPREVEYLLIQISEKDPDEDRDLDDYIKPGPFSMWWYDIYNGMQGTKIFDTMITSIEILPSNIYTMKVNFDKTQTKNIGGYLDPYKIFHMGRPDILLESSSRKSVRDLDKFVNYAGQRKAEIHSEKESDSSTTLKEKTKSMIHEMKKLTGIGNSK
jgi:hypothetical protein